MAPTNELVLLHFIHFIGPFEGKVKVCSEWSWQPSESFSVGCRWKMPLGLTRRSRSRRGDHPRASGVRAVTRKG